MPVFKHTAYLCDQIVFEDEIKGGAIVVDQHGKIDKVLKGENLCDELATWASIVQISEGVLMPGIIDSHVHVNSPGRSDWEDYPCATRAAAAGGCTTIVDMPLNSLPPTTTLDNLKVKIKEAKNKVFVDVAFWGGVIPGNQDNLIELIDAGVVGFKCFLCPSGVDEFPNVSIDDLHKALKVLENTDSLLAFHAECEIDNQSNESELDPTKYETYLESRPPEMEIKALKLIQELSKKYQKARYHIVHVSAAHVADMVGTMKNDNISITAETCPHYLSLTAEQVPDEATEYKCAPPVRSSTNRDALWNHIKDKNIDMIVSDHSPCTPALKTASFMKAWGGISSLQFGLSLIWTQGKQRGLSLLDVSHLMSAAPAKLCRLEDKKGKFKVGLDADFIIFHPDKKFIVEKEMILHKNKLTPYLGMELQGKVLYTYLRGSLIHSFVDNEQMVNVAQGDLLLNKI